MRFAGIGTQSRKPGGEQGLAAARRADQQQVVPAARGDFERAARGLLAAYVGQVERVDHACRIRSICLDREASAWQRAPAIEVADHLEKAARDRGYEI